MFPCIGPNRGKSLEKLTKSSPKNQRKRLENKYSFLLKPSRGCFIISPFIPKKLSFLSSPKRREKSPLKIVEVYHKEKPLKEERTGLGEFKNFRSLKPRILNLVCPEKIRSRLNARDNNIRGIVVGGEKKLSNITPDPDWERFSIDSYKDLDI